SLRRVVVTGIVDDPQPPVGIGLGANRLDGGERELGPIARRDDHIDQLHPPPVSPRRCYRAPGWRAAGAALLSLAPTPRAGGCAACRSRRRGGRGPPRACNRAHVRAPSWCTADGRARSGTRPRSI